MNHQEILTSLYAETYGNEPLALELLTPHASDRTYYRLSDKDHSVIGTYSADRELNRTFFEIGKLLNSHSVSTPEVVAMDPTETYYLQTDVGNVNALEYLYQHPDLQKDIIKKSLDLVRQMHAVPFVGTNARTAIETDLISFKENFILPLLGNTYSDLDRDLQKVLELFDTIPESRHGFAHRDFQLRNVVVNNGKYSVVDHQGAFRGPRAYDVASLLFSSKLQLSESEVREFVDYYGHDLTLRDVYITGLCRILQALGSYGKVGIRGNKRHFLKSVTPSLRNLRHVLYALDSESKFPTLKMIADQDLSFAESAIAAPIIVSSFSYAEHQMPKLAPHRLNFVFDARLFHNPGRDNKLKKLTGKDADIQQYLLKRPEFAAFVESITNTVMSVRSSTYEFSAPITGICLYIGCTGGRHRSVATAELVAAALSKTCLNPIIINHLNLSAL